MITTICKVKMIIHEPDNLKEKRSIVKSIVERTKKRYCISIIESNYQDYWQKSELSFSFCSMEIKGADRRLEDIIQYIESNPYVEIYDMNKEQIYL